MERRKREGREGGIKDSTLRYNKVHPWKPLPLPSLLHGSSITPFNLLCSSTLLIFPSVLGDPATLSCLRHSSLPPLQLACIYIYISGEGGGRGGRRGEETGKRVGRGVLPPQGLSCDGKFKNLSTRCRTTRGNFIISAHPPPLQSGSSRGGEGGKSGGGGGAVRRTTPRTEILLL